jgi:hypothetical protein
MVYITKIAASVMQVMQVMHVGAANREQEAGNRSGESGIDMQIEPFFRNGV